MPVVTMRLDDDLVERIDREAGDRGRSEWIRSAIEASLNGERENRSAATGLAAAVSSSVRTKSARVVPVRRASTLAPAAGRWSADDAEFLSMIGEIGGHPTQRTVEGRLGWQGLRGDKAFRRLLTAGQIRVVGGGIEVVE